MIIVEDLFLKKFVKVFKDNGIKVLDDSFIIKPFGIYVSQSIEKDDSCKDFYRSDLNFMLNIWGNKDGSRIELVNFKKRVIEILTSADFSINGYEIDRKKVEDIIIFKEVDGNKGSNGHYYHCVINFNLIIRGI